LKKWVNWTTHWLFISPPTTAATAEGTPTGTFSELLFQNGFPPLTMEQQLEKLEEFGGLDAWGGPHMANHFSVGWAYASSTPFQWTKQIASHFGGTMSATAIRYPKAIEARGEWRRQFQNVTDLVPTILEVTGVPAPDYVNGQKRKEYPGKSLTYAWNDADAKTNHPTQYFEMLGFMGLYHDGWTLAGKPYRIPWSTDPEAMANFDPLNTEWELYNIDEDPIQQVNVADQYPEKVKELEKIFWEEAENTMYIRGWINGKNAATGIQSAAGSENDTGNSHPMYTGCLNWPDPRSNPPIMRSMPI
jgi:arylsulfatase A-like enzyme